MDPNRRESKIKPVTQTRTGRPFGNCTEAAAASLLEIPLELLPDLCAPGFTANDPLEHIRTPERWADFLAHIFTVYRRMWFMLRAPERVSTYRPHEFPRQLHDANMWDEFCMLGGKNPDGVGHYTVGYRGIPCWDPNPRRRGLRSYNEISWLITAPQAAALGIPFECTGFSTFIDPKIYHRV